MPFIPQPSIYAFEIPIRNLAPTCQVDNILLTFMHKQRNEYVGGASEQQLIGPAYPSVSNLINPDKRAHPVSKVLTDILHSVPNCIHIPLPQKVAILYNMYLLLRASPRSF